MTAESNLIFPSLIYLDEYNGDFHNFFNAVYAIFENDFINTRPYYQGIRVNVQKFPEVDRIHRTFYHITHEGEDEQNRSPDMRRMERIRYPKFIIEESTYSTNLLIWEKDIKNDTRIHILSETERYLVVLTRRDNYLLLWTAFYIGQNHTLAKKRKEYDAYIKAKTA